MVRHICSLTFPKGKGCEYPSSPLKPSEGFHVPTRRPDMALQDTHRQWSQGLTPTKEIWKAAERLVSCFTGTEKRVPPATVFLLIVNKRICKFTLKFTPH